MTIDPLLILIYGLSGIIIFWLGGLLYWELSGHKEQTRRTKTIERRRGKL